MFVAFILSETILVRWGLNFIAVDVTTHGFCNNARNGSRLDDIEMTPLFPPVGDLH